MGKTLKRAILACSFAVLGASFLFADQVSVSNFKGLLNNNNNSVTIDPTQAQDLLNVDVTPGGLSVKKRSGYGLYKAFSTGQAVHGGYHAFDSTGNDYQIWGSSKSLYGIVADGTPTQLVSSATLNSTWDCADTQGSSYCVDSSRDAYIKTSGASITWFTTPLGTMVEATPDRVVVAGVSGSPNTLFVSQSNTFTNFTTGPNNTDAFTEVIASPGSKISHIRWGCGKLLWWKDASFGYFDFDNQYSAQIKIVSDNIGTFDNTSAIDPGGRVWFRGQDGHTWMYDCSSLTKESVDITPNVQISGKRTSNLWTQTSQSDWQAGSIITSANLSSTISPGDVIVSSYTATDTLNADFNAGTYTNLEANNNSIRISTNAVNVSNNSWESGSSTNWTAAGPGAWTAAGSFPGHTCGTINPKDGSNLIYNASCGQGDTLVGSLIDANTSATIANVSIPWATQCAWSLRTISGSSAARKLVKIKFSKCGDSLTSDSFISNGNDIQFYETADCSNGGCTDGSMILDFVTNTPRSSITSGSFISQTFNSGLIVPWSTITANSTANTPAPYIELQTAASAGGPWAQLLTSTGTNAQGKQYLRYISSFTFVSTDTQLTTLDDVSVLARSTGTFYSTVKNAPNITAWSTLGVNQVLNSGTETFYMRSATNTFTVLSATPAWTSQTVGGLVSIATGTFFQVRDDFGITAATQAPTLNDFTVNWFEGSASDQAYMLYFDNAIWESVAFGAGQSTNNYIFKRDLINDGWTLYNFGAGGMLVQSNTLYFGDTSSGNAFNYGTSTSDNGTAINAFWKSKDFTGSDPFIQNQLTQIDIFAKKNQGSTLTATYTTDTSTSTAYSISLSTTNAIVQSRKLLPSGKLGYVFNMKYGDTSASSAWEVFGFRIGYLPLTYKPTP